MFSHQFSFLFFLFKKYQTHTSGYRMVFASICERASSVFIFASTSIWQIFLASSEHFRTQKVLRRRWNMIRNKTLTEILVALLNEYGSMRPVAKILRARASEHPCNFCEQFEQRPNFASTFKLNETILHPYTWMTIKDVQKRFQGYDCLQRFNCRRRPYDT